MARCGGMNDRTDRWNRVRDALKSAIGPGLPWETRIAHFVDAVWSEFGNHQPVSWVGYYHLGSSEMTLGPRRDKPACSPIGLHGACGQAALAGHSLLVSDVRTLGANYIACDPKDLSELVVPVRDHAGNVVGVLDLDSYTAGAFDAADQTAVEALVRDFLN
jgi:putative methionine-R-sulfoxide reductase with GAF domain